MFQQTICPFGTYNYGVREKGVVGIKDDSKEWTPDWFHCLFRRCEVVFIVLVAL
jgi:hypothetical protein